MSSLKFVEVPEEEPLKNECKHFIEIINNNIQTLSDGSEGLKVVEIIERIYKVRNEKLKYR